MNSTPTLAEQLTQEMRATEAAKRLLAKRLARLQAVLSRIQDEQ